MEEKERKRKFFQEKHAFPSFLSWFLIKWAAAFWVGVGMGMVVVVDGMDILLFSSVVSRSIQGLLSWVRNWRPRREIWSRRNEDRHGGWQSSSE